MATKTYWQLLISMTLIEKKHDFAWYKKIFWTAQMKFKFEFAWEFKNGCKQIWSLLKLRALDFGKKNSNDWMKFLFLS